MKKFNLFEFTTFKGKFQEGFTQFKLWGNQQLQKTKQYIWENKRKSIIIGSISGIVIAVATFGLFYYQANMEKLYHVYVDEKQIGVVNDIAVVEDWKNQQLKKAQITYGLEMVPGNDITYHEQKIFKGKYDNALALDALQSKFVIQGKGVEVVINGKGVGYVKDHATAERVLNQIKNTYLPIKNKTKVTAASMDYNPQPSIQVQSIDLKEEISMKEVKVSPNQVLTENEMITLLQKGTLEEQKYIVKSGDTISEIAEKYGLTTKQVYDLNPKLQGEYINIGDELKVTNVKPLVTVQVKEIVIEEQRIPYQVVYEKDNTLYQNQTKVVKQGEEGKKKVEYAVVKENGTTIQKSILNEEVIKKPINKIVKKGTKISTSSISSRGSGNFKWPVMGGIITSPFGQRWGRAHTGIDISGTNGLTVKAADGGKVTFVGWKSGYGKTIIVSHGNNVETWYNHLSEYYVSEGDNVVQGQKIGKMGNTGNATGTVLHFEVRINGVPKNPINYVK
ncbi:peptidoglycan DD-metalloendopeptidase family protein [Tepidibacillus infernus]|uniref:peptidoglycan DD-metalloendopeptidase family protein n=1 Tax=Tepidibacillus infernus TaxID=1806172 RepID=UPI003B6D04D8